MAKIEIRFKKASVFDFKISSLIAHGLIMISPLPFSGDPCSYLSSYDSENCILR